MEQPVHTTSIRRAMGVIYPALLVGWLAFPGPVRDWASERAAQGLLPQAIMQRLHGRLNARLDERIR